MLGFAAAALAAALVTPGPQERNAGAAHELEVIVDLPYREEGEGFDPHQKLNLVLPKGPTDYPLLVWIGGGAWSYVDKDMEMDVARRIARRGIGVASIGHRLSSAVWKDPKKTEGVRHPSHIEDVAEAFRWVREHAAKYGYSRDNLFVGGFSSGGHLSALLGTDERRLARVGLKLTDIRGLIPIAGGYDISDYHRTFLESDDSKHMADQHVKAVFGDGENEFADASPTTYVDQLAVPMLLISESDTYRYTKLFEERLRDAKFHDVTVVNFHGLGHSALWKNLSNDEESACRDYIVGFIRAKARASAR